MRRKLYAIDIQEFELLFTDMRDRSQAVHVNNWPEDARVVGAHYDPITQRVLLAVESEEFWVTYPGMALSIVPLEVARVVKEPPVYATPPIPAPDVETIAALQQTRWTPAPPIVDADALHRQSRVG